MPLRRGLGRPVVCSPRLRRCAETMRRSFVALSASSGVPSQPRRGRTPASSSAVYATYVVNGETHGLKLTQWMRRNVSKDWRHIQNFYQNKRVWVVPRNKPVELPVTFNERVSGGQKTAPSYETIDYLYRDEYAPDEERGDAGSTSLTPLPRPVRRGHRHAHLKVKRERPRGEHRLMEGETIVYARSAVHPKFKHLLPEVEGGTEQGLHEPRRLLLQTDLEKQKEPPQLVNLEGGPRDSCASYLPVVDPVFAPDLPPFISSTTTSAASPPARIIASEDVVVDTQHTADDHQRLGYLCGRVLFEDTDYLIVNKPAGLPWGAAKGGKEHSLRHLLEWYLRKRLQEVVRRKRDDDCEKGKREAGGLGKPRSDLLVGKRGAINDEDRRADCGVVPGPLGRNVAEEETADAYLKYFGDECSSTEQAEKENGNEVNQQEEEDADVPPPAPAAPPADPLPRIDDELFPVYRLPQDMGGLMIVSKSSTANQHAKQGMRTRSFAQYRLLAVVSSGDDSIAGHSGGLVHKKHNAFASCTAGSGNSSRNNHGQYTILRLPLKLDPVLKILLPAPPDADPETVETAVLHYREVFKSESCETLLEIIPQKTPDAHLLRAAMAFGLGTPILGDEAYHTAVTCEDLAGVGREWVAEISRLEEKLRNYCSSIDQMSSRSKTTSEVEAPAKSKGTSSRTRAASRRRRSFPSTVADAAAAAAAELSQKIKLQNQKSVNGLGVLSCPRTVGRLQPGGTTYTPRQIAVDCENNKPHLPTSIFDQPRSPFGGKKRNEDAPKVQHLMQPQPEDFEDIVEFGDEEQPSSRSPNSAIFGDRDDGSSPGKIREREGVSAGPLAGDRGRQKLERLIRKKKAEGPFGGSEDGAAKMHMYVWQIQMRSFAGKEIRVRAQPPTFFMQAVAEKMGWAGCWEELEGRLTKEA